MCGIIASCSENNIIQDILVALNRLEYRGYDSSGIAFLDKNQQIDCYKYKGRVSVLENKISNNFTSNIAIGHTRWATHGAPSDVNSHPHYNEEIALVHNGIIENHEELKTQLMKKGYHFKSQTDTEVALVLLTDLIKTIPNKIAALQKMYSIITGSFAIVAIFRNDNNIYGIKRKNPMLVGLNEKESKNFISSDIYAITGLATEVIHIDDEEIVILDHKKTRILNSEGKQIHKEKMLISLKQEDVEKGPYDTYMLKEINEQPICIKNNINAHYDPILNKIVFPNANINFADFKNIIIIACGSSYNAGFIAKYWFEKYAKVNVTIELASEFNYKYNILNHKDALYVFISQSGETADTIHSISIIEKELKKVNSTSKTLAIINVENSQIARMTDFQIQCFSGVEIGVAATKSFNSQLMSLIFLCLQISLHSGSINQKELEDIYQKEIINLPKKMEKLLQDKELQESINNMCKKVYVNINKNQKIIWLGRNIFYGIAMEAALKTQELLYIPTLSFTFGELKHGPIAILDNKTLVICLSHSNILQSKTNSSIEEISARDAQIALISNEKNSKANYFIDVSLLQNFSELTQPLLYGAIVHLISHNLSLLIGNDVDKPRGLAKSVTVE